MVMFAGSVYIYRDADHGLGEDYKQIPNDQKVQEIDNYPLFLSEIKAAIGDKELSIAVPGREGDMIAFTAEKVPEIDSIVDHVNVSKRKHPQTYIHPLITSTTGHDLRSDEPP